MKNRLLNLLIMAGTLSFFSCSYLPDDYEINTEQLVDITKYDMSTDFSSFKTFAIVDSVSLIKDGDSSRVYNPDVQQLLSRIILNMENRGYTRVARDQDPDLGINVSVIEVTKTYYYPGWYWDYYAYYDPVYWGYPACDYWYPYFPPEISAYTTGTIIIDLLDLENANVHNDKIHLVWTAYIRGLMNGTHTLSEILLNVDQCFIQTPVLKTN